MRAAIENTNIQLDANLDVEILGGGLRIPKIKEMISKSLNLTLRQRLNQDEAICFGEGIFASESLGSRNLKIVQTFTYPIIISITSLYTEICINSKQQNCSHKPLNYRNTLAKVRDKFDEVRIVSLNYESDLAVSLFENIMGKLIPINKYYIKGIGSLNVKKDSLPKIQLNFETDIIGVIQLTKAKAVINSEEKILLNVEKGNRYPLPMTIKEIENSKAKINMMEKDEDKESKKSEARDKYESLIYSSRDWLKEHPKARRSARLLSFLKQVN